MSMRFNYFDVNVNYAMRYSDGVLNITSGGLTVDMPPFDGTVTSLDDGKDLKNGKYFYFNCGTAVTLQTIDGSTKFAINGAVSYTTPANVNFKITYYNGLWYITYYDVPPSTGVGTVTNVGTAGLISGGPITTTGTITTSMNTNRLVGRSTAGVGIMEEITLGTNLSITGGTLNAAASTPGTPLNSVQWNNGGAFAGFTGSDLSAGVFRIDDGRFLIRNQIDATKRFQILCSNYTTGVVATIDGTLTASRTISLPDASGIIVLNTNTATVTSKTFDNTNTYFAREDRFTLQNNTDTTKQVVFRLNNITTATTRTYTCPDATGFLVIDVATQTLTNKTFDTTTTIDIFDSRLTIHDNLDTTKLLQFELSSIATATTRTVTIPNLTGIMALTTGAQTFSNKTHDNSNIYTIRDDRLTLQDDADNTKQAVFQLSAIATGTTRTFAWPNVNGTVVTTGDTGTVSFTMMQSLSATSRLLGSSSTTTPVQEITLGTNLSMSGTTLNASGSGAPGGATTQVQFNNAGAFDGNANFIWDNTNSKLNLLGAGTAALPTLGIGSATSGIYYPLADQLGFATAGVLRFRLDATSFRSNTTGGAIVRSAAGGVSTPVFSFQGDTNTGIWNSAPDTMAFSCGGATIFGINDAGSFFGPVSNSVYLKSAAGTAALPSYTFVNDTDTGIYCNSANTIKWTTAGAQKGTIDTNGLMFIGGTTAPTAYVHAAASTTTAASLRLTTGTAPTTPNDGDAWNDSTQKALQTFLDGIKQTQVGCIFTQTADQTVTNTTTETTALGTGVGTKTLPANFFVPGKTIRLRVGGVYSTPGLSTPSVIVRVKYGSTVLASVTTTSLLSGASALRFDGEVLITCRTTGATGTVITDGDIEYLTGITGTLAVEPLNNSGNTTTIDTTTSNALDVTVQWDSATATRIAKATACFIEVLN